VRNAKNNAIVAKDFKFGNYLTYWWFI